MKNPIFSAQVEINPQRLDDKLVLRQEWAEGKSKDDDLTFKVCSVIGGLAISITINKGGKKTNFLVPLMPIVEEVVENFEQWSEVPV